MASEADTREHLRALVEALEGAFISTWQSTAAWQKELDAAREYLNRDEAGDLSWEARERALGVPASEPTQPLTREAIADVVRQHLGDTYHCTRVWEAWNVGTMSQEDFEPASESDMADEIADAVLALGVPEALPLGWQLVPVEPTAAQLEAIAPDNLTRPRHEERDRAAAIYRAMLAASPSPSNESEDTSRNPATGA